MSNSQKDTTAGGIIQMGDGGVAIIDFSKVDESIQPVPEGTYTLEVDDITYIAASQKSGLPMYKWVFSIAEPEWKGRKLFYNLSLSAGALWKFKRTLNAFGIEAGKDFAFDPHAMKGQQCLGQLTIVEFEGKLKNEIAELLPVGGNVDPVMKSVVAPF